MSLWPCGSLHLGSGPPGSRAEFDYDRHLCRTVRHGGGYQESTELQRGEMTEFLKLFRSHQPVLGKPPFHQPKSELPPSPLSKMHKCVCGLWGVGRGACWQRESETTETAWHHQGSRFHPGLPEAEVVPLRTCPPHSLLRHPAHCAGGRLPRPEGPIGPQRSTQCSAESAGEPAGLIKDHSFPHSPLSKSPPGSALNPHRIPRPP